MDKIDLRKDNFSIEELERMVDTNLSNLDDTSLIIGDYDKAKMLENHFWEYGGVVPLLTTEKNLAFFPLFTDEFALKYSLGGTVYWGLCPGESISSTSLVNEETYESIFPPEEDNFKIKKYSNSLDHHLLILTPSQRSIRLNREAQQNA